MFLFSLSLSFSFPLPRSLLLLPFPTPKLTPTVTQRPAICTRRHPHKNSADASSSRTRRRRRRRRRCASHTTQRRGYALARGSFVRAQARDDRRVSRPPSAPSLPRLCDYYLLRDAPLFPSSTNAKIINERRRIYHLVGPLSSRLPERSCFPALLAHHTIDFANLTTKFQCYVA